MADEWYYRLLGTEFGPVSFDLIFELARAGDLKPDNELRHGPDGAWARADSIVGLFPEPEELHDLSELDFQFADSATLTPADPEPIPPPAPPDEPTSEPEFECDFLNEPAEQPVGEWYCEVADRELGPMSWRGLQELARAGSLSPEDRVCCLPGGQWTIAATLVGLFDPAAAPRAEPKPVPGMRPSTDVRFLDEDSDNGFDCAASSREHTAPAEHPVAADPAREYSSTASAAAAALQVSASGTPARPAPAPRPLMSSLYESVEPTRPAHSSGRNTGRNSTPGAGSAVLATLLSNGKVQALVAAFVVGAIWYFAGGLFARLTAGTTEDHYKQLEAIYTQFQELRSRGASASDWDSFTKRAEGEQRNILGDLQRGATTDDPAAQELIAAARYDLSRMLRDARTGPNKAEQSYKERLAKAAGHLGIGGGGGQ